MEETNYIYCSTVTPTERESTQVTEKVLERSIFVEALVATIMPRLNRLLYDCRCFLHVDGSHERADSLAFCSFSPTMTLNLLVYGHSMSSDFCVEFPRDRAQASKMRAQASVVLSDRSFRSSVCLFGAQVTIGSTFPYPLAMQASW